MTDQTGFGTKIAISDDGSSYADIAGIHDTIGGPEMTADAVETTDHDSTGGYREYIGGLKDSGEVGFKINWDPADAQHDVLVAAVGEKKYWRITFPDGSSTATFQGILTKYVPDVPLDDRMTAEIAIKVSGQVTWA